MLKFKNKNSFSLLEVILAVSVFSIFITSLVGSFIYGKESTMLALNRSKAVFLAEEGIEALRNIRDDDFSNLVDGTYGLSVSGNQFVLTGSSDTNEIFTRQIVISTLDANAKQVSSTVTWQQNLQRDGSVSLTSFLSNWQALNITTLQADNLEIDTTYAFVGFGANTLYGVLLENEGDFPITIDKITVTWTNTSRQIQEIVLDNEMVWSMNGPGSPSDKQNSGTEIDIVDVTIEANSSLIWYNYFKFEGNIKSNTFTIKFTMSDGSSKTTPPFSPP